MDDRTFTITPSQYSVLQHMTPGFPIHAHFADVNTKRWGEGGPKVTIGTTVTFGGLMKRIVRERNIDRSLSFVEVEVCSIAYFSNPNSPISPTGMLFILSAYFLL